MGLMPFIIWKHLDKGGYKSSGTTYDSNGDPINTKSHYGEYLAHEVEWKVEKKHSGEDYFKVKKRALKAALRALRFRRMLKLAPRVACIAASIAALLLGVGVSFNGLFKITTQPEEINLIMGMIFGGVAGGAFLFTIFSKAAEIIKVFENDSGNIYSIGEEIYKVKSEIYKMKEDGKW